MRTDDRSSTDLPHGVFPPAAGAPAPPAPWADPGAATPAPPVARPVPVGEPAGSWAPRAAGDAGRPPADANADTDVEDGAGRAALQLPAGSPFAPPGAATPAPPTPLPRPWPAPAPPPLGGQPFRPTASVAAPPFEPAPAFGGSAAPGASGIAPPPQYDPADYAAGFGAAGGAPAGLVTPSPHAPHLLGPGPVPPLSSAGAVASPPAASSRTVVLVGVVSAIIASLITGGLFVAFGRTGSTTAATGPTTVAPAPSAPAPLDIHALLDKAQPSVVTIRTDTGSSREPLAAGSGVIISADGLVLTNAHVIAGATGLHVTLFDGTTKTATLVGSLPDDDIALIRVADPGPLVPAVLGDASELEVGDPVVAIGNAFNLGGTPSVTEGIVSAKDRDIQTSEGNLTNLIQTDAAINLGNSGGPLLNASGQVVGINTAILENSQNIGFAISIDVIKPRIEDLKNGKGAVTPDTAFLGVSTQSVEDVAPAVLKKYGVAATEGAFVSEVVAGSSAEDAGLQPGDVITSIGGKDITSSADVGTAIRPKKAGDVVEVVFEREGESQTVSVTLKSRATTGK